VIRSEIDTGIYFFRGEISTMNGVYIIIIGIEWGEELNSM
jgi:hypothetical protein